MFPIRSLALIVALTLSTSVPLAACAQAAPAPEAQPQAAVQPQEDDPRWDCTMDGNRVCGPGNAQGAPAGAYDQGGVLIETWGQLQREDRCAPATPLPGRDCPAR